MGASWLRDGRRLFPSPRERHRALPRRPPPAVRPDEHHTGGPSHWALATNLAPWTPNGTLWAPPQALLESPAGEPIRRSARSRCRSGVSQNARRPSSVGPSPTAGSTARRSVRAFWRVSDADCERVAAVLDRANTGLTDYSTIDQGPPRRATSGRGRLDLQLRTHSVREGVKAVRYPGTGA